MKTSEYEQMQDNMKTDRGLNTEKGYLTGMFADRESADKAYNVLYERGYASEDINLMMSHDTHRKHFSNYTMETGTIEEGAVKGTAIGGTIGAIAGIIAALSASIAIPGLGVIIAGPIAAGLAGGAAGGVTGGIIGALADSGIPHERAKLYDEGIKKGKILMGVKPRNESDAEYFEKAWRENRGEEVYR